MDEKWVSLNGLVKYGDNYEISNIGRVRNLKGRLMSLWKDKDGYVRVTFQLKNKKANYGLHRLVALAFITNLENKPEVNHKDGCKSNNNVDNLEWITEKENQQHAIRIGLREGVKGERNINAKLTDDKVTEIFNKYKTDNYSMQELADYYNVSISIIHNIVNGLSWTHLGLGAYKRDMSRASIITDELINKVKMLKELGLSKRKIEKETGVSRTTITKILEHY